MRTRVKRIVSVLLALTLAMMMLVAMPTKAFAASPPDVTAGDVCAIVNDGGDDVGYASLALAGAAVTDGCVVYLLANIDEDTLPIDLADFQLTINLNGFDLKVECITVDEESSLTITNSKPAIGGDITASYIDVLGGYLEIDTGGNTIFLEHEVYAVDGAKVFITANIESIDGYCVRAEDDGTEVTVFGNLTSVDDACIYAENGALVTVFGNLEGLLGVAARNEGTVVKVYGNIEAVAGISAADGAYVYLEGNITAAWIGVEATFLAVVEVVGNISVIADDTIVAVAGFLSGVAVAEFGEVFINGDITVEGDGGIGVFCMIGKVTVEGKIVAEGYVAFIDFSLLDPLNPPASPLDLLVIKTVADNDATSLKTDYLQYSMEIDPELADALFGELPEGFPTELLDDLTSYVWVRDTTPPTGDSMGMIVMMTALSLLALGVLCLLVWRKRQQVTAY
ncbi:MAG: hypothetical protein FWD43_01105 [Coriobacteriia bacterium]|nr:hypothetical protein [Coriobacteriia bacterium]